MAASLTGVKLLAHFAVQIGLHQSQMITEKPPILPLVDI